MFTFKEKRFFPTILAIHTTDLVAVNMNNGYFTIYKNREQVPIGTQVSESRYMELKNNAKYPIVLNEYYLDKDENGNIIY